MEESKELQGVYKIFRTAIYVSLLIEFFMYAIDPEVLDYWNGVVCDVHSRIKSWFLYHDGHLVYSKIATFALICITCVGTRNKKHLEFNARKQVLYPLVSGIALLIIAVWLFGFTIDFRLYSLRLNIVLYMVSSVIGTLLVHVALDNISKFLKEGLLKDRFNLENESFEQCMELVENKYSVNIPMRFYYKGKFRKGWCNITNPFRGTWVVGTPGSGKTFSIIEPFIRQHSAKGFATVKVTANGSLKGNKKSKHASESVARFIFLICAIVAILAVCSITIYMFIKGTESLKSVGIADLLFKTVWAPTATPPAYGIVYIILSSIVGTTLAILLGVPIGLLTAVFLTEIAGKKLAAVVQPAVELLAAIPSVIYGLLGLMLLNPLLYKLEKHVFANSTTHQYTGGANLLAAVLVLAIMILPTVINMSASAIRAVPMNLRATSLALGATKIQTIFKVVVPAAKSGIITGIVLGIGRALGEAMAINLVAGGSVNLPLPFNSVRFLTTQIVSEMSYADGVHRQVLFTVGLVLYIFIMIINLIITFMQKKGEKANG